MKFLTSLDNYNIFYEVARNKNITKASEKLFISQPAVSQAIKSLEENLGVSLFVRSKKGVELTQIGQKIFDKVELALRNFSLAENLIDEEKGLLRGKVVIGAGSNVARKIICQPLSAFVQDYPLIDITVVENVQAKMVEGMKNGSLDFVLTQRNEEISFPYEEMFETEYCFVRSTNCVSERFVTLSEGSFTYDVLKKFIKEQKFEEKSQMAVAGYKTALELVKDGIGTTLVPRYIVQGDIDEGKLEEAYKDYKLPKINFVVYYNPQIISPAGKAFLEYLKDRYE